MQLQDKGKVSEVSPALHNPHEVQRTIEYRAATVCFKQCLLQTSRVQCRNITCLYGFTCDLSGLREVQLSLHRPGQAHAVSRRLRLPRFLENRHMKVSRLSAIFTGRLYPQKICLVLISVTDLVDLRTK